MKKFFEGLKSNPVRIGGLIIALISLVCALYYFLVKPDFKNKKIRSYAMYGGALTLLIAPILIWWNKIKGLFPLKKTMVGTGLPEKVK